ncbi:nuclear transport factor 2 family protein [Hymenobacter persicinus]|uniref:Nuclear transport factor 2 family protein n=1 Tax=Hymenobacter persicinus TaxID=2025506 RepID=A0A4Q5L7R9_9BACT|nr:nuclear transport factor 2 family protein [Hymenobacter persicinus]RYU77227.1 nuclear transport factor 2 family protein [Hymenobacter persicinus]
MKKLPFLLVLLLALPVLTFAQSKKNLAAVKEVEALERQRFAAQVSKDYAYLDKVFADDLIYTHSNGKQNNKTEYVQSIKDGKSVYDKIDVEALNVRVYAGEKTAVVNGTITIYQPNKPDGSPNVAHLKYVVVQVKDPKKGWQVVLWQSQKQPEAKS